MNADEFNALYEVGVPVFAYPGCRPEDAPNDERLITRTRSKAEVLGGHTDVVWVDGHSACIALSHVDPVSEGVFKAAREAETAAAVAAQGALPVPGKPERLDDLRLTEIKSLLRYETSISFHSARAKESMLLLVAEVERQAAELVAVREELAQAREKALNEAADNFDRMADFEPSQSYRARVIRGAANDIRRLIKAAVR